MRELKFRAFNKATGNWMNPSQLFERDHFIDQEDWIVTQYTGLKDKNGREIYDGDIVRHPLTASYGSAGSIRQVKWDQKAYAFDFGMYWSCTDQEAGCVDDGGVEVIGNIYENPEYFKERR